MGYREALEAAGATVLDMKMFGSYQGDWFALVQYNSNLSWVHGSFGSCSYCDSFQSEFDDYLWDEQSETKESYQQRLKSFGERYLERALTQSEAEDYAKQEMSWDCEAEEMYNFIVKQRQ